MSVSAKKRERTQNWSVNEKLLLLQLCEENIYMIENKKSDHLSTSKKQSIWETIHTEYVATLGVERDVNRLKEQWRRMKTHARVELHAFANRVKAYGAEEANKNRPSPLSLDIWKLIELSRQYNQNPDSVDDDNQAREINWALETADLMPTNDLPVPDINFGSRTGSPSFICEVKQEPSDIGDIKQDDVSSNTVEVMADFDIDGLSNDSDICEFQQRKSELKNARVAKLYKKNVLDESQFENKKTQNLKQSIEELTILILEDKRREHLKRMQLLESELKTSELLRETAEINKQLAQHELKKTLFLTSDKEKDMPIRLGSSQLGEPGSGAGKGGGGGGAIREAGGTFGKMEAAREDEYFYKQQKEQLKKLKDDLVYEISFHEEQIKRHQEAITRHKQRVDNIDVKK